MLVDRYLMGRAHGDVFPWRYGAWVTSEGDERPEGSICTRHGWRPDGSPYPYWSVTGEVPEDIGRLICAAVNAYATKGWRGWLIRRLALSGSDGEQS